MSEPMRCETCGGPLLQAGALGGGCPHCLLKLGFESAPGMSEDAAPTAPLAGQDDAAPALPSLPRYLIVRRIGEGGMGVVYEAEQQQPRRSVAIKVIKPGLANPKLIRRFEQEAEALGRLHHPGIAQIYDAGTADMGNGPQPYFAMEFVVGRPLKEYANDRHMSARERLALVARIAEAVQHAHQRGLIHRDLKPDNILVDRNGQPKILDFGVARAIGRDDQATIQTKHGELVGTLAYMSPEQVLADPLELDTRTDVYALGVILYDLLAGRLPYTLGRQLHETIRAIREDDPLRLSAVNRAYRGDIETIVGKALEKDKARRYSSAAELAADIGRYLRDEPIMARAPSASYQLGKFARRHRTLAAGAAAVFAVLAVGVVAFAWEASQARDAQRQAMHNLDETREAEKKLQDALDLNLKERQLLEQLQDWSATVGTREQLERLSQLAGIYALKHDYAGAETQWTRVVGGQSRLLGEDHPTTLKSMVSMAQVYRLQGKSRQAENLEAVVTQVAERLKDSDRADILNLLRAPRPAGAAAFIPPAAAIQKSKISGYVLRDKGTTATDQNQIQLTGNGSTISATIGPDGHFEFENLRPGTYQAIVGHVMKVVVADKDVKGLRLVVPAGAAPVAPAGAASAAPVRAAPVVPANSVVTGRVSVDGGATVPALSLSFTGAFVGSALVQSDGKFQTQLPPGEYWIAAEGVLPSGYEVQSIRMGSTDLILEPLKLHGGASAAVAVRLGFRPPSADNRRISELDRPPVFPEPPQDTQPTFVFLPSPLPYQPAPQTAAVPQRSGAPGAGAVQRGPGGGQGGGASGVGAPGGPGRGPGGGQGAGAPGAGAPGGPGRGPGGGQGAGAPGAGAPGGPGRGPGGGQGAGAPGAGAPDRTGRGPAGGQPGGSRGGAIAPDTKVETPTGQAQGQGQPKKGFEGKWISDPAPGRGTARGGTPGAGSSTTLGATRGAAGGVTETRLELRVTNSTISGTVFEAGTLLQIKDGGKIVTTNKQATFKTERPNCTPPVIVKVDWTADLSEDDTTITLHGVFPEGMPAACAGRGQVGAPVAGIPPAGGNNFQAPPGRVGGPGGGGGAPGNAGSGARGAAARGQIQARPDVILHRDNAVR